MRKAFDAETESRVRAALRMGVAQRTLAMRFGVSRGTIQNVQRRAGIKRTLHPPRHVCATCGKKVRRHV